MQEYLVETSLLDFNHPRIVKLMASRQWNALPEAERIRDVYNFVKDEMLFGYNEWEVIPASQVLQDGMGHCNTKCILVMALLRGTGFPCRLHGFTVRKDVQRGAITGPMYRLLPQEIQHSWVEVFYQNRWVNVEGYILDKNYVAAVQSMFPSSEKAFCGFGIATDDVRHPQNDWTGDDTYIQRNAIVRDLGVFDSPDVFYREYPSNVRGLRGWLYRHIFCHRINAHLQTIRNRTGDASRAAKDEDDGRDVSLPKAG